MNKCSRCGGAGVDPEAPFQLLCPVCLGVGTPHSPVGWSDFLTVVGAAVAVAVILYFLIGGT